ncbi:MAG: GAF domain-containing sensor histidine kinase [Actinobacteria bacterium]|nr:GAF domain-containing sensor histidine kinase [Actinomycetota bacterium]
MGETEPADPTAAAATPVPCAGGPSDNGSPIGSAHLRALSRVSAALCGLSDLQAILRVGLDSVYDLLHGVVGGILLVDEDSQTLSYRIAYGLPRNVTEETTLEVGRGIAGRVVDTGRAIIFDDITLFPEAAAGDLAASEFPLEGLKALASIPIRSRQRVFGTINVASREPRGFGSDDLYVLHSIGEQIGVAIERAEVLEQLKRGQETYQRLARHYLVAQDEERRRIAHELHDETSQSISALALNMRALVEMVETSGRTEELIERMKKVEAVAQQTANELTRIINDLRPALLDSAGLVPAVRRFTQETLQLRGVETSVELRGGPPRLAPEVEATLFRFVQGAVSNVARHARASKVSIVIETIEDRLVLRIRDNGQGFDVSKVRGIDEKTGRGRGLFAMKERIRLLGGTCRFESAPGQGTTVVAEIPIKDAGNGQDTSPYRR